MNTCVACCSAPAASLACGACGQGVCCAPCASTYRERLVNNCCPFCRHAPLFPDLSGAEQKQMQARAAELVNPSDVAVWSSDDDDDDDQADMFASMPHVSFSECRQCGEFTLSGIQCPRCTLMNDVMLLEPVVITHSSMFHCSGCNRLVVAVPGETCLVCAIGFGPPQETPPPSLDPSWRRGRWNL